MKTLVLALIVPLTFAACGGSNPSPQTNPGSRTAAAGDDGFTPLPAAAWRGYRSDTLPSGWRDINGELTRVGGGGDIVTRDTFANFELRLEWKVAPGGNSGVMFRVADGLGATYESGAEMQVLDDSGHANGSSRLTAAGSNFDMHEAPAGVVRRAGEWNEIRLIANGAHVEHWLNGTRVVSYDIGSEDWQRRRARSKFATWEHYARYPSGRIALQDHGDWVAFRNIRIRRLP